jgi:hypothetical protein
MARERGLTRNRKPDDSCSDDENLHACNLFR